MTAPTQELDAVGGPSGSPAPRAWPAVRAPLLAAVGGIGAAASLAAWLLWPVAGAAVAAIAVAAVLLLRRRQPDEAGGSEPVPVELSARPRADHTAEDRL